MGYQESKLRAEIAAQNAAGSAANEMTDKLFAIFSPYVGGQVLKSDGTFLKKIADILPEGQIRRNCHPLPSLMYYRNQSQYSISFSFKASAMIEGQESCVYREVTLYVGELDGKTLKCLTKDSEEFKTDYSYDEIVALRQKAEAAKEAFRAAKSALYPFND